MTGKRRTLIVITAIVIAIGAIGMIALGIVNTRIANEVTRNIDETISSSGMEQTMSYDSVDVQSARGTVRLNGLRLQHPAQPAQIYAESVTVKVPPAEAIALARDPENATLSHVDVTIDGGGVDLPMAQTRGTIKSIHVTVAGLLSQSLTDGDPIEILRAIDSVVIEANELTVDAGPMVLAQMQMQGAPAWATDVANHRIDHFATTTTFSPERIEMAELEIESPLLTGRGSGAVSLSPVLEPMPESMNYEVTDINPELREQVTLVVSMFGQSVPTEGPFTLEYSLGSDGMPALTVQ